MSPPHLSPLAVQIHVPLASRAAAGSATPVAQPVARQIFGRQLAAGRTMQGEATLPGQLQVVADVQAGHIQTRTLGPREALKISDVGAGYALCGVGRTADGRVVTTLCHAAMPPQAEDRSEDAWFFVAAIEAQMLGNGIDDYDLYLAGGEQPAHGRAQTGPNAGAASMEWASELMDHASMAILNAAQDDRNVEVAGAAVGLARAESAHGAARASISVYATNQRVFFIPQQ